MTLSIEVVDSSLVALEAAGPAENRVVVPLAYHGEGLVELEPGSHFIFLAPVDQWDGRTSIPLKQVHKIAPNCFFFKSREPGQRGGINGVWAQKDQQEFNGIRVQSW